MNTNPLIDLLHLDIAKFTGIITIVDEDTRAELGHAFLQQLLNQLVKTTRPTICISFTQIYQHYVAIQKKMGCPLLERQKAGRFVFVDGLSRLVAGQYFADSTEQVYRPREIAARPNFILESTDLTEMESILRDFMSANPGAAIVIDGLTMLHHVGGDFKSMIRFLVNFNKLIHQNEALAIVNLHSLATSDSLSPQSSIIKQALFFSSYILQIQGLETGYSREVDGQVQLLRGPRLLDTEFSPQTLHFKLTDTNVRLLGRGLSSGLI